MWQKNVRYLDFNASAGISSLVREKLSQSLMTGVDWVANPSSRHRLGQKEHHVLFDAASVIANTLSEKGSPDDLIFTSSGTEANQCVIRSFVKSGYGVVIGAGEHSASFDLISEIKINNPKTFVGILPLKGDGTHDVEALPGLAQVAKSFGVQKLGLSLSWANNETGVIADLSALSEKMSSCEIPVSLHLDGAQVWGKLEFSLNQSPADHVTFSSHKIGAPAGVGVIWTRKGVSISPLIIGTQNLGLRGGSENLLGIYGLRFAAEAVSPTRFYLKTRPLQERLESGLGRLFDDVVIFGSQANRVSNTTRFGFNGYSSYENWVELLDLSGFAVSHGSACKARVIEPSRVLLAMGASRELALNSVRVSFGPESHENDVDAFLETLVALKKQKKVAG